MDGSFFAAVKSRQLPYFRQRNGAHQTPKTLDIGKLEFAFLSSTKKSATCRLDNILGPQSALEARVQMSVRKFLQTDAVNFPELSHDTLIAFDEVTHPTLLALIGTLLTLIGVVHGISTFVTKFES